MDYRELGKRIKEVRVAKKMTQSEVVGNFITRNMLSQIENGTATPSIKTLEYLCGVLNIPINQVMLNSSEDELVLLIQVKGMLLSEEYTKVIDLSQNHPSGLSDEFEAILTMAYIGQAKLEESLGNYKEAVSLIELAVRYSQRGIYINNSLKAESLLFLHSTVDKMSGVYLGKE